ncbi:hypothetical protein [Microcoleus sp. bin38.metabat.b11b12b14.051]|uniref:hypothetical protein n=1 Tax=Microcoleus sp. bin38.metabat.b11b12b14.051 TaxID=2742709 RepID=UPI0025D31AB6|nr:hypothetical protein [Microcoleus sp. bin38.metabat.b11b12b14.051]
MKLTASCYPREIDGEPQLPAIPPERTRAVLAAAGTPAQQVAEAKAVNQLSRCRCFTRSLRFSYFQTN